MEYTFHPQGICCYQIDLNIDNDIITDVKFHGGCDGNHKAIASLVNGLSVDEIEEKCTGIKCGFKPTSCGDQLAKAVREAYNASKQ